MTFVLACVCLMSAVFVVATSPVRGVGRWLAPDAVVVVLLAATFGIRPLFSDRFSEWTVNGYIPGRAATTTAMVVGTVALASLAVGALLANGRSNHLLARPNGEPRIPGARPLKIGAGQVLILSLVFCAVYFLSLLLATGSAGVASIWAGRTRDSALTGIPEIATIAPLAGSALIAAFVISRRRRAILPAEWILLGAALLPVLVSVAQAGSRRLILPALLLPLIACLMRSPQRLRLWHVGVAFTALLVLAVVPFVRSAGARVGDENLAEASWRYLSEQGVSSVVRPIFTQWDTGMSDFVAVVIERSDSFGYGRGTLLEFVFRPLPSTVQPIGMPYSDRILTDLYGGGCWDPYCPVASTPGILYFDGGLPLVLVGSLAVGYLARRLAFDWQNNELLSDRSVLLVAICCSYALVFIRTNSVHALWWIIYTAIVAWFALGILSFFNKSPGRQTKAQKSTRRGRAAFR